MNTQLNNTELKSTNQEENKETQIMEPSKIDGFNSPTIWFKYNRLSIQTKSANLGHGFPDWSPPEFLMESLARHFTGGYLQYTRTNGHMKLAESIAKAYSESYKREINPMTEVLVTSGGVNGLYTILTGLVEKGDEVITLEPFYDCYLPQTQFCGGKVIGIPLLPPPIREKKEYLDPTKYKDMKDFWTFDFEGLKKALSSKTKVLILNTPNNSTGKILSYEELNQIKDILEDYPNVTVVMDEVYEHAIFDDYDVLPRMASIEGMFKKTVTIHSAGKIFSCTGLRIGWVIAPQAIIKKCLPVFAYSSYCINEPAQLAMAETLENAEKPYKGFKTYYKWCKDHFTKCRNMLIAGLAKLDNFEVAPYIPQGGLFVMGNIAHLNPKPKYILEGDDKEPDFKPYTKDYNWTVNLAMDQKVISIPCSPFFTKEHKHIGTNYIRMAFCKTFETIELALERMKGLEKC